MFKLYIVYQGIASDATSDHPRSTTEDNTLFNNGSCDTASHYTHAEVCMRMYCTHGYKDVFYMYVHVSLNAKYEYIMRLYYSQCTQLMKHPIYLLIDSSPLLLETSYKQLLMKAL